MLRLLAKVRRTRRAGSFTGKDGLQRSRVHCYVTIKSPARSTFKLPRGLKGKSVRVLRTYIHPWRIKAGDLLVLDPDESEAAVREHVKLKLVPGSDIQFCTKRVSEGSRGSDGLQEYTIENVFLRSVISPDYGARILELWNMGTGKNELYGGYYYGAHGYVEMGGIEESLSRVGKPPDLWNASFKKREASGYDLSFEYTSKKKEGLKVLKSFRMLTGAPVLCQFSTFEFKPKIPRKKKKRKKPEMELNYVPRVLFGIGEEIDHTNLFLVPTDEQLVTMRYNIPAWEMRWSGGIWDWKKKWHAVKPGFVLLANDRADECMALFVDPRELNFAWIGRNGRTPRIYLPHIPKKLKATGKVDYSIAVSVGIAYDLTRNSLLIVSRGKKVKAGTPFGVVYRTLPRGSTPKATFVHDGERRTIELEREHIRNVGDIFFSSFLLEAEPQTVSAEVEAGNEHLKAAWTQK